MADRPILLERLALIEKALDFALRFGPVVEDQWATAQRARLSIGSERRRDEFPPVPRRG